MNIKKIFGIESTPAVRPEYAAMAERVSTLKGCAALVDELGSQAQDGAAARSIRRKLDEARRLLEGHEIRADRGRVNDAVKRDRDNAVKAAKEALKNAREAQELLQAAEQRCIAMEERIGRMQAQLGQERAAAARRLQVATGDFAAVVRDGAGEAAEVAAASALHDARRLEADAGAVLSIRIDVLREELKRLRGEEHEAREAHMATVDTWDAAMLKAAQVDFDVAAQGALDAYLTMYGLRRHDQAGRAFPGPAIDDLGLSFFSSERALCGRHLCGDNGRVRQYKIKLMVRALAPANLDVLVEVQADAAVDQMAHLHEERHPVEEPAA